MTGPNKVEETNATVDRHRRAAATQPTINDSPTIQSAISTVVEQVESTSHARALALDTRQPRNRERSARFALALCFAFLLYLWLGARWLGDGSMPEPQPNLIEAGLRLDMYHVAHRIEANRGADNSVPTTLHDLAIGEEILRGIDYQPLRNGGFRLFGSSGMVVVDYVSSVEPESLIRNVASLMGEAH